jgi:hypothetical protein
MSKNRNRIVTGKTKNNKEYNVLMKNFKVYCRVCNKRYGTFDAYCGPRSNKQNKNWKRYRVTQWKVTQVGEGVNLLS